MVTWLNLEKEILTNQLKFNSQICQCFVLYGMQIKIYESIEIFKINIVPFADSKTSLFHQAMQLKP